MAAALPRLVKNNACAYFWIGAYSKQPRDSCCSDFGYEILPNQLPSLHSFRPAPAGMINPYKILGLKKKATYDEIRQRWRSLAKTLHPDIGGNAKDFDSAKKAHDILIDPAKRAMFDSYGIVDGDPQSAITINAIRNLKQLFSQVLMQVAPDGLENCDLVGILRNNIEKRKSDLSKTADNLRSHQKRQAYTLSVLKHRLKQRGKTVPNFFAESLEDALKSAPGQIAQLQAEIEIADEMLRILKHFTYDFIVQSQVMMTPMAPTQTFYYR